MSRGKFLVFALVLLPFFLVSCGDRFVGSVPGYIEPLDLRVVGAGTNFVFAFVSNENVKIYNFEKLVSSFDRRAEFVTSKSKKLKVFQKVTGIFVSDNLSGYGFVGYRGAQWLCVVGDNEFGLYNYVKGISFSSDGSRFGFVYNVGGEVSNDNVLGGKYYVNIDGYDNGPYDDAMLPIFTTDNKVILVVKELGFWKVKYDTFEYGDYEDVIVPSNPVYEDKVIFLFKKRNRWYMNGTTNVFGNVVFFDFNNGNYLLGELGVNNKVIVKIGDLEKGFRVLEEYEGISKGMITENGNYYLVVRDGSREILIVNGNSFDGYQNIDRFVFSSDGKHWGIRYKKEGKFFVDFDGKKIWSGTLADFAFYGKGIILTYLDKNNVLAKEISFDEIEKVKK